jgi:hypothetical protein
MIPSVDNSLDIGSTTYRWRDMFLGPDSLKIIAKLADGEAPANKEFKIHIDSSTGNLKFTETNSAATLLEMSPSSGVTFPTGMGSTSLDDLTDVDTSSQASGKVLTYTGSTWEAEDIPDPVLAINDLSDVGTGSPTAGDLLSWDSSGEWRTTSKNFYVYANSAGAATQVPVWSDTNGITGSTLLWDTSTFTVPGTISANEIQSTGALSVTGNTSSGIILDANGSSTGTTTVDGEFAVMGTDPVVESMHVDMDGNLVMDAMQQYISVTLTGASDSTSGLLNPFDTLESNSTTVENTSNGITYDELDGKFTVAKDGVYKIDTTLILLNDDESDYYLDTFRVRKNESSNIWSSTSVKINNLDSTVIPVSVMTSLSSGDYLEVEIDSDTTKTLVAQIGSTFNMMRIA